jgi:hypothetical protein
MNALDHYPVQISLGFNIVRNAGLMLSLHDATLILALMEDDDSRIISAVYGYGDIINKKIRDALMDAYPELWDV